MQWLSFPDPNCQVCGLPWFSETAPMLWRFPERMKACLPETLFEAGRQTAGGRLRFRTDTGALFLKARFPGFSIRTNMTQYTAHGISTYVDGRCRFERITPGRYGLRIYRAPPGDNYPDTGGIRGIAAVTENRSHRIAVGQTRPHRRARYPIHHYRGIRPAQFQGRTRPAMLQVNALTMHRSLNQTFGALLHRHQNRNL